MLLEAGGVAAPRERRAQLRTLLGKEMEHGRGELARARSGYDHPVVVAVGDGLALAPVDPALRADPDAVPERARLLVGALLAALVEAGATPEFTFGTDLDALAVGHDADPELAVIAFEESVAEVNRLRAAALALPPHVLAGRDMRPQLAAPAASAVARPHDDPEPARRVARRILQRLAGMGKWGGYHTDFSHLARGFAGNDRALADAVGEALLAAGILEEKTSVGQRHVYLNPRRAADVYALVDDAVVPGDLRLPS